jgi:MFS family permease
MSFFIAFFTTIVRYYDYALFGFAASILSKNFLPHANNNDYKQILSFFAIFSLAVITKPIGAYIFGTIADKKGVISSIKISSIIGTISTIAIGLMPNFEYIGGCSVILLFVFRTLFLISMGAETDTIRIYITRKISDKYKNLGNGLISFCNQIGVFIAAIFLYYISTKMKETNITYLWRINFIIGGIAGICLIILRHYFSEIKPYFKKNNKNILILINQNREKFIPAMIISGCSGGIYNFFLIFLLNFSAKIINITELVIAYKTNIFLIAICGIFCPISGFIADKVIYNNFYKKSQIFSAITLSIIINIVFLYLISILILDYKILTIYIFFMILLLPFYLIPLQIIIQSLFDIEIKARMCSISHAAGSMLFSATVPFFSMCMWQYYDLKAVIIVPIILLTLILCSASYLNIRKYF